MTTKNIKQVINPPRPHWVGDGFHVHNFIPSLIPWTEISPFVMLDYGATKYFEPTKQNLGVGSHPHRGFETVTIAYQGEIEHHDSRGNRGIISEGEVQWMTAGSGILHKEYHSKKFAETGGNFQMVQLWVNLPAKDKMTDPKYQAITKDEIVKVDLEHSTGKIEIISGEYSGRKGPARTFSEVNLWNLHLNQSKSTTLSIPADHNCALLIVQGEVVINGQNLIQNQIILMKNGGQDIVINANENSIVLVLSGEPINEPIASYGPFLMNTKSEIVQAIDDFNEGKFGELE